MTLILEPLPENTKRMTKPCDACPYSPGVTPGALGGSDPAVYIGQGHGAFWLPCHKTCDFGDPEWKTNYSGTQQCAGAAIYRANIKRDALMPAQLLKLPASDQAFESAAKLYAHHKGISLEEATAWLLHNSPEFLMHREFHRAKY